MFSGNMVCNTKFTLRCKFEAKVETHVQPQHGLQPKGGLPKFGDTRAGW